MASKPRTTFRRSTEGGREHFIAVCGLYGRFVVYPGDTAVRQLYHRTWEEVGHLAYAPRDYENFKVAFTAWWEDVAPWENIAFDIVIYDRFGRPMGAATEHKPVVARRCMRNLLDTVNGARGVILRRNKRTLEVKQVAGFKRRARRAPATV